MASYKLSKWNLKDLLKKPQDAEHEINKLLDLVKKIELYQPQFTPSVSVETFKAMIQLIEQLALESERVKLYSQLWFAEDMQNNQALALKSKLETLGTDMENRLLFFSQTWKRFPEKDAERLIKALPHYAYYLRKSYQYKKYMLSTEEERIINIKDLTGSNAVLTVYEMLTSGFTFDFDGKKLTQEELFHYVRDPDPKKRIAAYQALYAVFQEHRALLGEIYKSLVLDWNKEFVELRKYTSSIAVRNFSHDIQDSTVETLLNVCKKNQKLFQKYFEIKSKKYKIPFNRYHLYAPPKMSPFKMAYPDAVKLVLDAYQSFSPIFRACAEKILQEQHLDSEARKNKSTGAFCAGESPTITPYVLLSYTGDLHSINTLAHELGHGIHHLLSSKQNVFYVSAVLPLAETASIFGELLLMDQVKKLNPKLAKELLVLELDGFYGSIGRQAEFVAFEKEAHRMVLEHASTEDLAKQYFKMLKAHFGKMEIPDHFQWEWLYINHIFTVPFYCYAYSFGNLLALSLYAQYKKSQGKQREAIVEKIIHLLSQGSNAPPEQLVADIGYDITQESFWQSGFDVMKEMVKELQD